MTKKIHVLSFDYDNCLNGIGSLEDPYAFHQAFFEGFIKKVQDDEEVILTINSLRQFTSIDFYNSIQKAQAKHDSRISFTFFIEKLLRQLKEKHKNIKWTLSPFLMGDVFENTPHGTTHEKIKSFLTNKGAYDYYKYYKNYADYIKSGKKIPLEINDNIKKEKKFSETEKFSTLYAQIHKHASENQEAEINFDFFDDSCLDSNKEGKTRRGVLQSLSKIFSEHPHLIPKNVTLTLHWYERGKYKTDNPEFPKTIKGTGAIDSHYDENIKKLFQLAFQPHTHKTNNVDILHKSWDDCCNSSVITPCVYDIYTLLDKYSNTLNNTDNLAEFLKIVSDLNDKKANPTTFTQQFNNNWQPTTFTTAPTVHKDLFNINIDNQLSPENN